MTLINKLSIIESFVNDDKIEVVVKSTTINNTTTSGCSNPQIIDGIQCYSTVSIEFNLAFIVMIHMKSLPIVGTAYELYDSNSPPWKQKRNIVDDNKMKHSHHHHHHKKGRLSAFGSGNYEMLLLTGDNSNEMLKVDEVEDNDDNDDDADQYSYETRFTVSSFGAIESEFWIHKRVEKQQHHHYHQLQQQHQQQQSIDDNNDEMMMILQTAGDDECYDDTIDSSAISINKIAKDFIGQIIDVSIYMLVENIHLNLDNLRYSFLYIPSKSHKNLYINVDDSTINSDFTSLGQYTTDDVLTNESFIVEIDKTMANNTNNDIIMFNNNSNINNNYSNYHQNKKKIKLMTTLETTEKSVDSRQLRVKVQKRNEEISKQTDLFIIEVISIVNDKVIDFLLMNSMIAMIKELNHESFMVSTTLVSNIIINEYIREIVEDTFIEVTNKYEENLIQLMIEQKSNFILIEIIEDELITSSVKISQNVLDTTILLHKKSRDIWNNEVLEYVKYKLQQSNIVSKEIIENTINSLLVEMIHEILSSILIKNKANAVLTNILDEITVTLFEVNNVIDDVINNVTNILCMEVIEDNLVTLYTEKRSNELLTEIFEDIINKFSYEIIKNLLISGYLDLRSMEIRNEIIQYTTNKLFEEIVIDCFKSCYIDVKAKISLDEIIYIVTDDLIIDLTKDIYFRFTNRKPDRIPYREKKNIILTREEDEEENKNNNNSIEIEKSYFVAKIRSKIRSSNDDYSADINNNDYYIDNNNNNNNNNSSFINDSRQSNINNDKINIMSSNNEQTDNVNNADDKLNKQLDNEEYFDEYPADFTSSNEASLYSLEFESNTADHHEDNHDGDDDNNHDDDDNNNAVDCAIDDKITKLINLHVNDDNESTYAFSKMISRIQSPAYPAAALPSYAYESADGLKQALHQNWNHSTMSNYMKNAMKNRMIDKIDNPFSEPSFNSMKKRNILRSNILKAREGYSPEKISKYNHHHHHHYQNIKKKKSNDHNSRNNTFGFNDLEDSFFDSTTDEFINIDIGKATESMEIIQQRQQTQHKRPQTAPAIIKSQHKFSSSSPHPSHHHHHNQQQQHEHEHEQQHNISSQTKKKPTTTTACKGNFKINNSQLPSITPHTHDYDESKLLSHQRDLPFRYINMRVDLRPPINYSIHFKRSTAVLAEAVDHAIAKEFVDNTLKESILMSTHLGYSIQHPLPHAEHWFGLLVNYLLSHKNSIHSLKKSIILTQKVISSSTIRVNIDEIICGLAETNNIIGELLGKLKEKEYRLELNLVCRTLHVRKLVNRIFKNDEVGNDLFENLHFHEDNDNNLLKLNDKISEGGSIDGSQLEQLSFVTDPFGFEIISHDHEVLEQLKYKKHQQQHHHHHHQQHQQQEKKIDKNSPQQKSNVRPKKLKGVGMEYDDIILAAKEYKKEIACRPFDLTEKKFNASEDIDDLGLFTRPVRLKLDQYSPFVISRSNIVNLDKSQSIKIDNNGNNNISTNNNYSDSISNNDNNISSITSNNDNNIRVVVSSSDKTINSNSNSNFDTKSMDVSTSTKQHSLKKDILFDSQINNKSIYEQPILRKMSTLSLRSTVDAIEINAIRTARKFSFAEESLQTSLSLQQLSGQQLQQQRQQMNISDNGDNKNSNTTTNISAASVNSIGRIDEDDDNDVDDEVDHCNDNRNSLFIKEEGNVDQCCSSVDEGASSDEYIINNSMKGTDYQSSTDDLQQQQQQVLLQSGQQQTQQLSTIKEVTFVKTTTTTTTTDIGISNSLNVDSFDNINDPLERRRSTKTYRSINRIQNILDQVSEAPFTVMGRGNVLKAQQEKRLMKSDKVYIKAPLERRAIRILQANEIIVKNNMKSK